MLTLFAGGALGGCLAWLLPLSGWVALVLPLVIPPLGMFLTWLYC